MATLFQAARARAQECWKRFWHGTARGFTGEWMFLGGRAPNGGSVIFCRSIQVAFILYLIALWLRSLFNAQLPWQFEFGALWHGGAQTVPWFGAIFSAVYAALYARFASQWSYLNGVKNQLRQTLVSLDDLTNLKEKDRERAIQLELWRAGFVEDALDLHLATKPVFGRFLLRTLTDPGVQDKFDEYFSGPRRRKQLQERLNKKFASGRIRYLPDVELGEDDMQELRQWKQNAKQRGVTWSNFALAAIRAYDVSAQTSRQ